MTIKSIEHLFAEHVRADYPNGFVGDIKQLRRAFFAGFNKMYCTFLDITTHAGIDQYEREMDKHSEEQCDTPIITQ